MKVTIQPSQLKGIIQAPASKSSMQRACAAALFSSHTRIYNAGKSNDDLAALDIIQKLGARIEKFADGSIKIDGVESDISAHSGEINCGESGLSIRMFTPIIALCRQEVTVTGRGSLVERPMGFFDEILPQLGVAFNSNNGRIPFRVKGVLTPKDIEIDGSLSSQYLTGLLFAYAAAGRTEGVTIKVKNLKSKPYVDLTLDVMKHFGMQVPENRDYKEFYFPVIKRDYISVGGSYTVESDWSGGAFLLVAGAIAGSITVTGLDPGSSQADNAVLDALMAANAGFAFEAKGTRMSPAPMNAFNFDATDCPDLFPPLVALAAYCQGETKIKGVSRLTHKESNRALTLQEEFAKMDVKIELNDDVMIIHGGKTVKGAVVHSRHDHRIAMALAVAALKADGETIIEEAQAVKKSYPGFYSDLKSLHASLSLPFQFTNIN